MPRWIVGTLRAILAIALAGSVLVQVLALYFAITGDDPMPMSWRVPFLTIFLLGIVGLQVIGVNIWKLVTMVRQGTVFSPRAFRHVNWVIGAILAGAVLIFAFAVLVSKLPDEDMAPGVVALICGASFVTAGVALTVYVMRLLLQQAVDATTRATALQSELDEVI